MAASKDDIRGWFDVGVDEKHTHMIVVRDTFDHDDYPVYASSDTECREKFAKYNGQNMQRVMEVYDLRRDKEPQLRAAQAWHLPA